MMGDRLPELTRCTDPLISLALEGDITSDKNGPIEEAVSRIADDDSEAATALCRLLLAIYYASDDDRQLIADVAFRFAFKYTPDGIEAMSQFINRIAKGAES
jgi:hypothetical protein